MSDADPTKRLLEPRLRHELRTPLTTIIGYAEMLHDDAGTDERAVALLTIGDAGRGLLACVETLLAEAEIAAVIESGDVNSLLAALRDQLRAPIASACDHAEALLAAAQRETKTSAELLEDLAIIAGATRRFLVLIDLLLAPVLGPGQSILDPETRRELANETGPPTGVNDRG